MSGASDTRWHNGAESRLMAEANGWCMVRRPRGAPYVIPAKDWHALPDAATGRQLSEDYAKAMLDPANWNLRP